MNHQYIKLSLMAGLALACLPGAPAVKAESTNIWVGTNSVSLTTNWSDHLNWTNQTTGAHPTSPAVGDDVAFFDNGDETTYALSTVGGGPAVLSTNVFDSVVDVNTTIHWLWLGQTNGYHNIYIPANVTLTVQGTNYNNAAPAPYAALGDYPYPNPGPPGGVSPINIMSTLYAGQKGYASAAQVVQNSISGAGTLSLNNTNNEVNVRNFSSSSGAHPAILDLSALNTFNATLGRIKVGCGEIGSSSFRALGTFYLALTNNLTLVGTNYQDEDNLVVGNAQQNNDGNSTVCYLYLGLTNRLFLDTVLIGGRKEQGNLSFNPNLTNTTYYPSPAPLGLYLRGHDGVSPVNLFRVGDESDQNASGNGSTGTVNLNSGYSDMSINTLIVGKNQTGGGASPTGNLTVGDGNVRVGTLEIAAQADKLETAAVTGNAYFHGTSVTVSNTLQMGLYLGGNAARNVSLNLAPDQAGNPATMTVLGTIATGGTAAYNITNSTFAFASPASILANTINLVGGAISNASLIQATNGSLGLGIYNNGQILGSPAYNLGFNSTWDVEGISNQIFNVNNLLEGLGTVQGNVTLSPGATISPGSGAATGTLNISSGATLGGSLAFTNASLAFGLSASGTGGNDQLSVANTLTVAGINDVFLTSLAGSLDTANPYTLITASTLSGSAANFVLAGTMAEARPTFVFDTTSSPNNLLLHVTGANLGNLIWVGGVSANLWDLKNTSNWKNINTSSADKFYTLDSITFDDSGSASPALALSGTLIPNVMTVATTNKSYTFGGTGSVSPSGALTVVGTGPLTFANSGGNTFNGLINITGDTVTLSNNAVNTIVNGLNINTGASMVFAGNSINNFENLNGPETINIGTGSGPATLSIINSNANTFNGANINLNGTLLFNQSVSTFCDANITGSSNVVKSGTGVLALTGNNSGMVVQINGGSLQAGSSGALNNAALITASGGTLDLYGQNLGSAPVTAAGAGLNGTGAVVNTGPAQTQGLTVLTLTGDTYLGGSGPWGTDPVENPGRWDLRGGTLVASTGSGNSITGFNLFKVGLNQVTIANSTVDTNLANINVQAGLLGLEGALTSLGKTNGTLTISAGASVSLYDTANSSPELTKQWVLNGDGVTHTLLDYDGANLIAGPVTLNGTCIIGTLPAGLPQSLEIDGVISGSGSFDKTGSDVDILTATNLYTGNTTVANGTLQLSGGGSIADSTQVSLQNGATLDASERTDGTFTLFSGQSLTTANLGTVNGNLVAEPGSTIAPGGSAGLDALSVNGNVTLAGITSMKLDPLLLDESDQIDTTNGVNTITYGGTLELSDFAGSYAIGQSFTLFNAASYAGAFASILPAQPGNGLAWNTNALATSGIISIVSGPSQPQPATIHATSLAGTTFTLSGTGGAANRPYAILTSTNLTLPLSQWTALVTNNYAGDGSFSATTTYHPGDKTRFYIIQSQ